jgi:uncharacterized membrane protein (DUF485 family)
MDSGALVQGLLMFVAFVAFVSLHEFAHAWTAAVVATILRACKGG